MRIGPHQIGTTGASDGDALLYDADLDEYAPGPVATTVLVPWTTTLSDGTFDLMYDDGGNLTMVEVPQ